MWPSDGRDPQANAAREYLDKHNLVEFTQLLVQSATWPQIQLSWIKKAQIHIFVKSNLSNLRSSRSNLSGLTSSWRDSPSAYVIMLSH